jgi:hypothetical protein
MEIKGFINYPIFSTAFLCLFSNFKNGRGRVRLLKAGIDDKTIENLYIISNNLR